MLILPMQIGIASLRSPEIEDCRSRGLTYPRIVLNIMSSQETFRGTLNQVVESNPGLTKVAAELVRRVWSTRNDSDKQSMLVRILFVLLQKCH